MKKITFYFILLTLNVVNGQWSELGGEGALVINDDILTVEIDDSGNTYVAGRYENESGKPYVSKFDGTSWVVLGDSDYFSSNAQIESIHFNDGKVYAVGSFLNASSFNFVAVFDGVNWSELGGDNSLSATDDITVVTTDNNGDVYVAGYFENNNNFLYVAKYNGTSWSELGGEGSFSKNGSSINDIAFDSNNNAYVVGDFISNIIKYDGASWVDLPRLSDSSIAELGVNSLQKVSVDSNDNVYTAGSIVNGNFRNLVAKYDGISWSELGGSNSLAESGFIYALEIDADDNFYIGGVFANDSGNKYVAHYDGVNWSELEGDDSLVANDIIQDIAVTSTNKLVTVGNFTNIGGSQYVAITENEVLSIADLSVESLLVIYIDSDILHVKSNDLLIKNISIYGIDGQELKLAKKDVLNIDISTLNSGLYLVNVKTLKGVIIKKVIKG